MTSDILRISENFQLTDFISELHMETFSFKLMSSNSLLCHFCFSEILQFFYKFLK